MLKWVAMEPTEGKPLPEPNPVTYRRHRREMFRQVILPLIITMVIVLILAGLTLTGDDLILAKGAEVATIWLIMPMLVLILVLFALSAGAIYGLLRLMQFLPRYTRLIQDNLIVLRDQIGAINDKALEPIFRIETMKASLRGLVRSMRRK